MDLVFKVTAVSPSSPPVIGETNFKAHYTGINHQLPFDEIKPGIRQATQKFVMDFVGEELYNDLASKFQTGAVLSSEQQKALEILQDCVAYYSVAHLLPERRSILASMGVMENDPTAGSNPASFPIYKEKLRSALTNGDLALDRLLSFLEKMISDGQAYFDLWKDSAAFNIKKSDFFRQTADLDEYLNIQRSRRSFISLQRYLKQVEEDVIKPLLCDDLYADVLAANPTDANKKLLPMIRRAVAYLGAAEGIPHHRIVIDGDGFRVISYADGIEDRRNMTNNVHEAAIGALLSKCQKAGAEALAKLYNYLENNLSDYPDYEDSACREAPAVKSHTIRVPDSGIGVVGIF